MAEVDTSIYKNAQAPSAFDQIKQLGGALDTIGNIQVGQALQKTTGPDGTIDRNALANILKQNPASAMKIIPTLEMEARMRHAGFSADIAGYEAAQKRFATINHLIAPLAMKDKVTGDDVLNTMSTALDPRYQLKKYGVDLGTIMKWSSSLKQPNGQWLPPDQLKQKVQIMHQQGLAAQQALEAYHPRQQIIDQGGQITMVPAGSMVNPATGTAVPKGLPPGTTVFPPQGGQPQLLGPQPAVPGGGAVLPGGKPAVPGTTVTPPAPAAPLGAAQPPGYEQATAISGTQMAQARGRAANFGAEVYPLTQALSSLETLGTKGTGPGTDEINSIKSFLLSNAPWSEKLFSPEQINKIQKFDEAKKYLTAAAGARAQQFGHGTDQALATALTANPNTHISNLAAIDLTKATLALRRMEQAQILEADRTNVPEANFGKWAGSWAAKQDPRAYMIDLMTDKQKEELIKSLNKAGPAAQAKFRNSLKSAEDNGIVTRGGGATQ